MKKHGLALILGIALLAGGIRETVQADRIRAGTPSIRASSPSIRASSPAIRAPVSSVRSPTSKIRTPTPGIRAPSGTIRTPSSTIRTPTRAIRSPSGSIRAPTPKIRSPRYTPNNNTRLTHIPCIRPGYRVTVTLPRGQLIRLQDTGKTDTRRSYRLSELP